MKHIKPANKRATVMEALENNKWVTMIMGTPTVQGLVEYMNLWDEV
jgi:hypothetical protein